jgi:hypothetical protein
MEGAIPAFSAGRKSTSSSPISLSSGPSRRPHKIRRSAQFSSSTGMRPFVHATIPLMGPSVALLLQVAKSPTLLQRLADVAGTNPVLTLLALLITAFAAGFGVRKLFEDRELGVLRADARALGTRLAELRKDHEDASEQKARDADVVNALGTIFPLRRLRESFDEHLSTWAESDRELIFVGVVRQLLSNGGRAAVCRPDGVAFVTLSLDPKEQAWKVTKQFNRTEDPWKELRGISSDDRVTTAAIREVAIYGFGSLVASSGGSRVRQVTMRQLSPTEWRTEDSTFERVGRVG